MSISVTELRAGVTIEFEGQVYVVIEYNHVKMGRGGAIVRVRLKNIKTGSALERTFKASEKVEPAHVERKSMQFLYCANDEFHFMDQDTFEQISINAEQIGDIAKYLKEGFFAAITSYEDSVIGVEIPASVELKIVETGPGFRGDTVSGGSKPATLETGIMIQVPLFINTGDIIKVDTRTGKYVERV